MLRDRRTDEESDARLPYVETVGRADCVGRDRTGREGERGSAERRRPARFLDVLRILHAAGSGQGGRLCRRDPQHEGLLGRHARSGRHDLLGGFRRGLAEERRAHRRTDACGQDRRSPHLRRLLLQGIPSQPGPRLGIGSDRFPERVCARRADRRAGLQGRPCRAAFGRSGMGRGNGSHPLRRDTGPS